MAERLGSVIFIVAAVLAGGLVYLIKAYPAAYAGVEGVGYIVAAVIIGIGAATYYVLAGK